MINKGWDGDKLDAMSEPEFVFWVDQQNQIEEIKAKALDEAYED